MYAATALDDDCLRRKETFAAALMRSARTATSYMMPNVGVTLSVGGQRDVCWGKDYTKQLLFCVSAIMSMSDAEEHMSLLQV